MNVLSLFDGISCGQVALERVGIKVDNYYASEIDKYAIQITQKNYPGTIQIGDIQKINLDTLPKIDLLMGGSPCQGFSFAGKQLNFEDPRSKLFFDYVRVYEYLKKKNPDIKFLLENVKMKKEYQDVISGIMGVEPIEINSALVSAQNRKRLYWTNIEGVGQPEDKVIYLKDIVFSGVSFYTNVINKPNVIYNINKSQDGKVVDLNGKSLTLTAGHNNYPKVFNSNILTWLRGRGHIPSLLLSEKAIADMDRQTKDGRTHWDFKHHSDIKNQSSAAVVANFFKGVPYNVLKDLDCIRKFHPVECERLQTLPDNYTEGVSNTQRYKSIGNGWTVDVIAHIFNKLKE